MQDGDLDRFVKARAGQLLDEDTIMLMFVQICLAVHYIHSKVSLLPSLQMLAISPCITANSLCSTHVVSIRLFCSSFVKVCGKIHENSLERNLQLTSC